MEPARATRQLKVHPLKLSLSVIPAVCARVFVSSRRHSKDALTPQVRNFGVCSRVADDREHCHRECTFCRSTSRIQ